MSDRDGPDPYLELQRSEGFANLRRTFRSFVFPMTAVFLSWYLLYVIASGWARDFMNQEVVGHINVALIFGLLQFVSTFLIASLHQRFANRKLDPLADRVADEFAEAPR